MYKEVTECRICGGTNLREYLDLGQMPLVNALATKVGWQETYPLKVLLCGDCSLSQLSIVVPPETLYKDYPYNSSVSETFKKHCFEMAKFLKAFSEDCKPMVVDIASNDGCLLEQFKRCNYYVMGVEPCTALAERAEEKGIPTINAYWNEETAKRLPTPCKMITATNVLAHVDDVKKFIKTAKDILTVGGGQPFEGEKHPICRTTFMVVEVPYLYSLIKNNQFDTIYHEHLSYFLFKPLKMLFESCGMTVFRVEQHEIHGGSLRVYASPVDREVHQSVPALLSFEKEMGLYTIEPYLEFSQRVKDVRANFKRLLQTLWEEGKKVMGYGASAKGTVLMNYCGAFSDLIEAVIDDTPDKQGKFIPGCGIPIVNRQYFEKAAPDYLILFAWNFAWELIENTWSHKKRGGKYVIPIPQVCTL